MEWKKIYKNKVVSVEEAASKIKSGDRVWIQSAASTPAALVNAMCNRYQELENVEIHEGLAFHVFDCFKAELKGHISDHSWYMGGPTRKFKKFGNINYASIHLSKLYEYIEKVAPTVTICEVSQPDEDGYMCYGPSGVVTGYESVKTADRIIVQVNKNVPFIYGENNKIHVSEVTYICENDHPVPELPQAPMSEEDKAIAKHIIPYISDGSTIQLGIGGTANAVGYGLEDKKDLGVHSEMLTDSMVYLAKIGVINNSKKNYKPGKMVISFGLGSKELYEFMDKNPSIEIKPFKDVNDPQKIAKNDNLISINNALSVDLIGQVSSDSIGYNQFSSTGGQLDFVRGAVMSKGGKSFICLPSTVNSKEGRKSRIVMAFSPGTAVTVPRTDAQYIVTEYGVADVYCKSIQERAKAIISIAHPDYREELTKQAIEAGLIKE
ncbi:acetyl-CoA hydrolase/transferase C-terminal domain-containing protein [Clostridium sediminicola]|uniref:acetyl-CoA hydrolase/transferase family protein n=1 Tax=Clostridium sediminicola TaxID=3114879 RepID=UPI0031F1F4A0